MTGRADPRTPLPRDQCAIQFAVNGNNTVTRVRTDIATSTIGKSRTLRPDAAHSNFVFADGKRRYITLYKVFLLLAPLFYRFTLHSVETLVVLLLSNDSIAHKSR